MHFVKIMTKPTHCHELAEDEFDTRHASAGGESQWQNSLGWENQQVYGEGKGRYSLDL